MIRAEEWVSICNDSFVSGEYSQNDYVSSFKRNFKVKPKDASLLELSNFYELPLLWKGLSPQVENKRILQALSGRI